MAEGAALVISILCFVASGISAALTLYVVDDLSTLLELGRFSVFFLVLGWAAFWVEGLAVRAGQRRGEASLSGRSPRRVPQASGGSPGSIHQTPSDARTGPRSGGAAGPSSYETWPYRIGDLP